MPPRTILHVDMDAFYAAVEQRDRPDLRGKPVIVGGPRDGRGVVSAASYEARRFGVHSAMPSRTAAAKCPEGIFLPPRLSYYAEVSEQIHGIFARYTALVESLSLDEAFLDVTGSRRVHGDGVAIGRKIQRDIRDELDLDASVGVAPNKFLAKLASDLEKPNGFVVLTAEAARGRIAPLPIERLWGVGRATARRLRQAGYTTFGALADEAPDRIKARLGSHGLHLQALAQGRDERPVVAERAAKSIGRETTFAEDTGDREVLRATLYQLAESVGRRLRRAGLRARTVTLKIRFDTFETWTRDRTLGAATNLDEVLFGEVWSLLEELEWPSAKVRLIGVSTSHFAGDEAQLSLFAPAESRQEHVARVADIIRDQWGSGSIRHAGALRPPREETLGHG